MKAVHSISEQTRQFFLQESADLLQTIDSELQTLRGNFSLQKVHALMRATHTLKGAAASVGLDNLVQAAHALEDAFNALCYDDTVVSQEVEKLLFEGYDCLQQLVSAQQPAAGTAGTKRTKASTALQGRMAAVVTLDRMAIVMARLQDLLGDRFGQQGHIPASAELGFDLAQSIFEMGVAQRIEALAIALAAAKLDHPQLEAHSLDSLRDLLRTQAEVFIDLAESLDLPGFGEIATVTLKALAQQPDRVLEIASVALENFKAAQAQVLNGDRTTGGSPSAELQQFYDRARPLSQKVPAARPASSNQAPTAINNNSSIFANSPDSTSQKPEAARPSWFKRQWQMLTQPIGETAHDINHGEIASNTSDNISGDISGTPSDNILNNLNRMKWGDLTPDEEAYLDMEPEDWDDPFEAPAPETSALETLELETSAPEDNLSPSESSSFLDISDRESDLSVAKTPLASPLSPNLQPSASLGSRSANAASSAPSKTVSSSAASSHSADVLESDPRNKATVRVAAEHLDQLDQAMGELLTQQNRQTLYNDQLSILVKRLLSRISQQQQQLNQQKDQTSQPASMPSASLPGYNSFDTLELDRYSDVQRLAQSVLEETVQQSESAEAIELFVRQSAQALEKQKRLLSNTREILLSTRMVPLEKVFQRFASAVDRLQSKYAHKQVELVLKGGEVMVDSVIADKLYEPLLHLVRNAFDHGIEVLESRLAHGKVAAGKITIEGLHQGRNLVIRVADDGRGIDLDRIRRKAVETKRMSLTKAAALTDEQTIELLFESGFSTKHVADELSGRGVGLEAVREQVRSLKGWVGVNYEASVGSDFTLNIPASLTIANLLLCEAKGRVYALFANAVERILIPTEGQVRVWEGGKMLTWQAEEEHLIPISELAKVLNDASPVSGGAIHPRLAPISNPLGGSRSGIALMPVVLLRDQTRLVGLEVDRILGEQELVINPLGKTIVPPDYLYGSSLLPDGQLTLVLDGATLAKRASALRQQSGFNPITMQNNATKKVGKDRPIFLKKLILTVDDSITVRNTLSEVLQKANYQVVQAQDGAEALQQLERYPDVEAILCDIEMPGMNGFEFLKARMRSPHIAAIPTIMLTSRSGTKHRLLSQELGATGYLTKPYLNPHLLKTVSKALEQKAYQPLSVIGETL